MLGAKFIVPCQNINFRCLPFPSAKAAKWSCMNSILKNCLSHIKSPRERNSKSGHGHTHPINPDGMTDIKEPPTMLANSSDNQKFMIYPRSLVGTVAGGLGFVWLVRITQIELPLIFQHFLLLNFLISWSFFQFPPHDIVIRSRALHISPQCLQ